MRITSFPLALLLCAISAAPIRAGTLAVPIKQPALAHGSAHDFDFLYGHWTVRNRRLAKRLADSHEWIAFDATDDFQPLPAGIGTEEHYRTEHWPGFAAIGIHLYDPASGQWGIYWADNTNQPGAFQPAQFGSFSKGLGTFEGADTFDGRPITVRVTWRPQGKRKIHWEQAFSTDHGRTWETNWTMDFVR